jgi:hypothetical protein
MSQREPCADYSLRLPIVMLLPQAGSVLRSQLNTLHTWGAAVLMIPSGLRVQLRKHRTPHARGNVPVASALLCQLKSLAEAVSSSPTAALHVPGISRCGIGEAANNR